MLQESRMVGEIVVLAMLENEDALFVEKVAIEYEVWNLGKLLQCVWWIGKDEIELLLAGSQKAEYIATNQKIPVLTISVPWAARMWISVVLRIISRRMPSSMMRKWRRESSGFI
jgi:hypothetical protein